MSNNQPPKHLDDVIARCLEQVERGESPDREQLLREGDGAQSVRLTHWGGT